MIIGVNELNNSGNWQEITGMEISISKPIQINRPNWKFEFPEKLILRPYINNSVDFKL